MLLSINTTTTIHIIITTTTATILIPVAISLILITPLSIHPEAPLPRARPKKVEVRVERGGDDGGETVEISTKEISSVMEFGEASCGPPPSQPGPTAPVALMTD